MKIKPAFILTVLAFSIFNLASISLAASPNREEKRKKESLELQENFKWWPTDALPAPVEDKERGGYWWWPKAPGKVGSPWGNRGYCYLRKIIFDYKEEELPAPQPQELRASLLIKKIIKNVKIYFDYDKAQLRDDARLVLGAAVKSLNKNLEASILITGNCDIRGSEAYNEKLGRRRGDAVKQFMLDEGIAEEKIKIVSRGKLDAAAPVTDLVGMQKERNAQFMIAEIEEVMLPYNGSAPTPPSPDAQFLEEGKYLQEQQETLEGEIQVSTKEYVVKKGDTLSGIAKEEYGKPFRWKYLYQLNKGKIKNPDKLKPGLKIIIPVE